MSRTKKGSKPPGYDYWSARPHSQSPAGRITKTLTHRSERQQSKGLVRKELKELE